MSTLASPPPRTVAPRKKSRKKLFVILALVIIAGVVIFGLRAKAKSRDQVTRVSTEKAITKTITQVVSATGKIQPEVEVKISPEVSGEILEMPFREGALIKKGELLVRIKPDNLRFAVDQREADLVAAKASAADSKVRFLKAEADFRRSDALFTRKLIPEADAAATKATYESAAASYESAQANIRRAEGQLKQAQDSLEKTAIYAPMDGSVSSRTAEIGERAVATAQFTGTELMRIADLTNMELRVNINENDIVNVKVGDKASVAIDAFPGRKFEAAVKEIGSAAKVTGQNTQEEVTNFQVKIRILDKDVPIRPGMSANADIETKTVENVIAVPIQSVTVRARESAKTIEQLEKDREAASKEPKGAGDATAVNEKQKRQREKTDKESTQRVVFVKNGDSVKMVPVETGISDMQHLEVKSGIAAGDEVVSGSYAVITRTLKDGMKVQLDQPKKTAGK